MFNRYLLCESSNRIATLKKCQTGPIDRQLYICKRLDDSIIKGSVTCKTQMIGLCAQTS